MTDNIWMLTHATLSQRTRCIRISSITWNDESISAWCLVPSAHLFHWQAENREEREMERSGWRISWRGCRIGDAQQLTPGILGVQPSAAWPISRSSERSFCIRVSQLEHNSFWVCIGCLMMCVHQYVCVYIQSLSQKAGGGITSGGRCELWTTNEATDWQLVFVAKLAPIYPLSFSETPSALSFWWTICPTSPQHSAAV